jgi:hypothetical protein
MTKCIFLIADRGLALIYFLQSEVVPNLLANRVKVILFTDDDARQAIEDRFHQPGLIFEGLRLEHCERYFRSVNPSTQRCLQMLRWAGGSNRINVTAMDGNYHLLVIGFTGRGQFALPFLQSLIWLRRGERAFDIAFDEMSNLRLNTEKALVLHMENRPPETAQDPVSTPKKRSLLRRVLWSREFAISCFGSTARFSDRIFST